MAIMIETLKVDAGTMSRAAGEFDRSACTVKNTTDQMLNKVRGMQSFWRGSGFEAYKAKLDPLQATIDRLIKMIREHSSDLQRILQEYQSAESEAQSALQGLDPSSIII